MKRRFCGGLGGAAGGGALSGAAAGKVNATGGTACKVGQMQSVLASSTLESKLAS